MNSKLSALDETALSTPSTAGLYERVRQHFLETGKEALAGLRDQAQQGMRNAGVTFTSDLKTTHLEQSIPFDPFPRVLSTTEWTHLAQGLEQRLRIWNAFLKDIYSSQEVLRADILPVHWVYEDPNYHRGAVNVALLDDLFAHLAAFDLLRDENGNWVVTDDHLSHTTGTWHAIQARLAQKRTFERLPQEIDMEAAEDYPEELLERLRSQAPLAASEPRVVLFSTGATHQAYFEHSSLARWMGIPVVQASDLIVLNSHVYFKTIGGLEPIHVLYRRIDELSLDPLEFDNGDGNGVAGLMNCVRKGTVVVANAIGSGLGDSRIIGSAMARLAKFYFDEPLLIPTRTRFVLEDPDQAALVLDQLGRFTISPTASRSSRTTWSADQLSDLELKMFRERIKSEPRQYLAETRLPPNHLPCVTEEGLKPRHAGLRLFVFGGKDPHSACCALTRFSPSATSLNLAMNEGAGIKDTWIVRTAEEEAANPPIIISSAQRRLRLGSRTAENLYWMAAYSERAGNTARILRVLPQDPFDLYPPPRETLNLNRPLLEALLRASSHAGSIVRPNQIPRRQTLVEYFLQDPRNNASVRRYLLRCRQNAREIRETIPPEVWSILRRIDRLFDGAAKPKGQARTSRRPSMLPPESVLDQLDALSGTVRNTMLRGDPWDFWTMGESIERALNTVMVLRPILIRRTNPVTGRLSRDDRHLDSLLGMLSSQYAYRSLRHARPTPLAVARMLLQDVQVPRSVLYCLQTLQTALDQVALKTAITNELSDNPTPARLCAQLRGEVEFADLRAHFDASSSRTLRFRVWLDQLTERMTQLSRLISDHYINHQAFNIIR